MATKIYDNPYDQLVKRDANGNVTSPTLGSVDRSAYNTAGDYNAPTWNNSYRDAVDTSYYNNAVEKYKSYAEQNRANQLGQAEQTRDSALKEAYITKMQNQKSLNDALARSGIRGGTTETSNLRLQNQYGTARAAANTDYSNSVNSINQAIDQNIFDYTSDMESRAEEYKQNMANAMWNADREDYANKWNAQREDDLAAYNAAREDLATAYNANREDYNNYLQAELERGVNKYNAQREDEQTKRTQNLEYYNAVYSAKGKKDLKSDIKSLTKQIKKLQSKKKLSKSQKQKLQNLKLRKQAASTALANK